jgi:hypothetical protein
VGPEETLRVTEDIVEKFKIKLQPIKDFTQVRGGFTDCLTLLRSGDVVLCCVLRLLCCEEPSVAIPLRKSAVHRVHLVLLGSTEIVRWGLSFPVSTLTFFRYFTALIHSLIMLMLVAPAVVTFHS